MLSSAFWLPLLVRHLPTMNEREDLRLHEGLRHPAPSVIGTQADESTVASMASKLQFVCRGLLWCLCFRGLIRFDDVQLTASFVILAALLANVHFRPAVCRAVTILAFSATSSGLGWSRCFLVTMGALYPVFPEGDNAMETKADFKRAPTEKTFGTYSSDRPWLVAHPGWAALGVCPGTKACGGKLVVINMGFEVDINFGMQEFLCPNCGEDVEPTNLLFTKCKWKIEWRRKLKSDSSKAYTKDSNVGRTADGYQTWDIHPGSETGIDPGSETWLARALRLSVEPL